MLTQLSSSSPSQVAPRNNAGALPAVTPELSDRERQLAERERELALRQAMLEKAETAEKERQLAIRERQLAERERQIAQKRAAQEQPEKDRLLAERTRQLAEQRAAQEQGEKDRQLAEREKQLKDQQEANRSNIIIAALAGVLSLAAAAGLVKFWMYRRANKANAGGHKTSTHIATVSSVLTERSKALATTLQRWIASVSSGAQGLSSRGVEASFALAEKSKAFVSEFERRVETVTDRPPTTRPIQNDDEVNAAPATPLEKPLGVESAQMTLLDIPAVTAGDWQTKISAAEQVGSAIVI